MKRSPIAVIGAGSWGTALAIQLARNGNDVRLWDFNSTRIQDLKKNRTNEKYLPGYQLPENISLETDLPSCLADLEDILITVPSHAFRSVLEKLKSHRNSKINIAWGTKGFDSGTRMLLHEVVFEIFGADTAVAVLTGPSFAKEVAAGKPTAVSIAGNRESFINNLIDRFHARYFRVYRNKDLIGIQVCGAVKNVIAIAVGVADGLQLGANARAALITRGLAEISRLSKALGGLPETMLSLAGLGDLVLTCTDDQSRNRRCGLALAKGVQNPDQIRSQIGQEVEGINNAREIAQLAHHLNIEMPIVDQVNSIIQGRHSIEEAISELLAREPKEEGY